MQFVELKLKFCKNYCYIHQNFHEPSDCFLVRAHLTNVLNFYILLCVNVDKFVVRIPPLTASFTAL